MGGEGLKINFESFENPDKEEVTMEIVDASLIMLSLAKMLKDSGLGDEELHNFMSNIYEYAIGDKNGEIEEIQEDPEISEIEETERGQE
jgi:hypothetical protein